MLPINCRIWQLQLPELPKSCQQWELIFLSILTFRTTKILSNLRAGIPVASELCNTWKMLCFPSTVGVVNYSFQSYLKPGRCYTSYQLLDLASVASRATKILSTVGVDIYVDLSFQGYQNPIKLKSWHTCSFRAPGRCYASHQLSELSTVVFRAT